MSSRCIACSNRKQVPSDSNVHISFYGFPKDEAVRKEWIKFCGRQEHEIYKTNKICSDHFTDDDFIDNRTSGGIRWLKKGAIPTVKKKVKKAIAITKAVTTSFVPVSLTSNLTSAVAQGNGCDSSTTVSNNSHLQLLLLSKEIATNPCRQKSPVTNVDGSTDPNFVGTEGGELSSVSNNINPLENCMESDSQIDKPLLECKIEETKEDRQNNVLNSASTSNTHNAKRGLDDENKSLSPNAKRCRLFRLRKALRKNTPAPKATPTVLSRNAIYCQRYRLKKKLRDAVREVTIAEGPSMMVTRCIVCGNTSGDPLCESGDGLHLSFHGFPPDQEVAREWMKFCGIEEHEIYESTKICSDHFIDDDFIDNRADGGNRVLKKGRIPSVPEKKPSFVSSEVTTIVAPVQRPTFVVTPLSHAVPLCNGTITNLHSGNVLVPLKIINWVPPTTVIPQVDSSSISNNKDNFEIDMEIPPRLDEPLCDIQSNTSADSSPKTPPRLSSSRRDDFSIEDFGTPRRAKQSFEKAKSLMKKQKATIKCLQDKNRRLLKKIKSMEGSVLSLLKKRLGTEEAAYSLMIGLAGRTEYDYLCHKCSIEFEWEFQLVHHYKTEHKNESKPFFSIREPEQLTCELCNYKCYNELSLYKHHLNHDQNIFGGFESCENQHQQYECERCKFETFTTLNLVQHIDCKSSVRYRKD